MKLTAQHLQKHRVGCHLTAGLPCCLYVYQFNHDLLMQSAV